MLRHLRNVVRLLRLQRSSRHKNCRIGGLMLDSRYILEISLQTVFYPGFSKRNAISVQGPILGKRIVLADKSDYITLLAKFGNCCSTVQAHKQGQWKGKHFSLSFSEEAANKLHVVLQCIFGRDFLSPHTTIASGVENYPSASMSCRSDYLAQLLPCLDL